LLHAGGSLIAHRSQRVLSSSSSHIHTIAYSMFILHCSSDRRFKAKLLVVVVPELHKNIPVTLLLDMPPLVTKGTDA